MTKQEYQHIRLLALDLLIDAKIKSMPTDVKEIAKLYNAEYLMKDRMSTYDNALVVSGKIISILGYDHKLSRHLAIRILAPMVILKEINPKSANDLSIISGLPIEIATQRYNQLLVVQLQNRSLDSHLEKKVLHQFSDWIINFKSKYA